MIDKRLKNFIKERESKLITMEQAIMEWDISKNKKNKNVKKL